MNDASMIIAGSVSIQKKGYRCDRFVVQHLNVLPAGEESVRVIGVYRSLQAAHSAAERLRSQPGFRDHSRIVDFEQDEDEQGFCVEGYQLDAGHQAVRCSVS